MASLAEKSISNPASFDWETRFLRRNIDYTVVQFYVNTGLLSFFIAFYTIALTITVITVLYACTVHNFCGDVVVLILFLQNLLSFLFSVVRGIY